MTRLFLSLYLFITISLIALSAGLERVFFSPQSDLNASQRAWLATFTELRASPDTLISVLNAADLNYSRTSLDRLAVAQSIQSALLQGELVQGFSGNLWQVYVPVGQKEVLDIRLLQPADTASAWWLYSGVFFILLGALIAIWMYPLWRDLRRLIHSTKALQTDGSIEVPPISARSPLQGIANALSELSANVKTLLQNQRELSGAITHEFRTPLARLKFALAEEVAITSEQLSAARNDIDELDRLIQEMLDFTRLDVHQPELHIEDIPLFDLCEQRAVYFRKTTQHCIEVVGDCPRLNADGHFIARAIDNLLSNAIRHTFSKVCIRVQETASDIRIQVEDDGPGIDEQYLTAVFDPFFRPDASRARASGGAGLGLAIVKRIQHWHNGDCMADNSPMGGARLTLVYPRNKADVTKGPC